MVLEAKTKMMKNKKSSTFYLTIPASMVQDSLFPFGAGEEVELKIDTRDDTLVVSGEAHETRQKHAELKKYFEA